MTGKAEHGAAEQSNAVGRPSKLNEEMIACAWAYLKGGYQKQGNAVPSAAGLAFALGVSRKTVYNWGVENQEFLHILEAISTSQEMMLIDGGLSGDFNAPFAKMMMAKHGYSDKQEISGPDGGAIAVVTSSIGSIFEK